MDVFSYLLGPVYFPPTTKRLTTHIQLLVGGARVAGAIPDGAGGFRVGYVHYPAWAFGGGAEYPLTSSFALRGSVDYLHTYFFNSAGAVRGQNNLRVVNSIVYYFHMPRRWR